jgi:GNAT superfamily N-acetyltransferase
VSWHSLALDENHAVGEFDCGVADLNEWLAQQSVRAQRSDTARTYVWIGPDSKRAVAYFSITPTEVRRVDLSGSMAGGVSVVPGYLLARLALDRSLHGTGLGAELLVNALSKIVTASSVGGGRIIVVDAIDDRAVAFYEHHGFTQVKNNRHRLVMKMATARAALGRR